jgi:hypothetical protein
MSSAKSFKRFDVRPLVAGGQEPLPEILQRMHALKPNEGLIVVSPFLPSPLVETLNSEGFASKIERGKGVRARDCLSTLARLKWSVRRLTREGIRLGLHVVQAPPWIHPLAVKKMDRGKVWKAGRLVCRAVAGHF